MADTTPPCTLSRRCRTHSGCTSPTSMPLWGLLLEPLEGRAEADSVTSKLTQRTAPLPARTWSRALWRWARTYCTRSSWCSSRCPPRRRAGLLKPRLGPAQEPSEPRWSLGKKPASPAMVRDVPTRKWTPQPVKLHHHVSVLLQVVLKYAKSVLLTLRSTNMRSSKGTS